MASNITPGTQQYAEVTNPTGLAGSTTTASSGSEIPDQTPAP
mgnify:CR=1 FL=1